MSFEFDVVDLPRGHDPRLDDVKVSFRGVELKGFVTAEQATFRPPASCLHCGEVHPTLRGSVKFLCDDACLAGWLDHEPHFAAQFCRNYVYTGPHRFGDLCGHGDAWCELHRKRAEYYGLHPRELAQAAEEGAP